jgi:glycogen debranching enzyme
MRPGNAGLTHAQHRAREKILTQSIPAHIVRTVDAVVLEESGIFLLTDASGDVPLQSVHALGLYREDCRFLDGLVLTIGGRAPVALSHSEARGFETVHHLTNPDLPDASGAARIAPNTLAIDRHRCVCGDAVFEEIAFHNHGASPVSLCAELRFRARFEDVFVVKKFSANTRARAAARVAAGNAVVLERRGRDGALRRTWIRFERAPSSLTTKCARFDLALAPGERIRIRLGIATSSAEGDDPLEHESIAARLAQASERPAISPPRCRSSSGLLDRVLHRAVLDLDLLQSQLAGSSYYAAGIPWFATLFGRDAAITALQTLPFRPEVARDTLALLARYQASEHDAFRDAAPGKILHELRRGELASLGRIPQSPAYYGSVDATPLFLILLCSYTRWSGDLGFALELRAHCDRALDWIAREIDSSRDGFLAYSGAYSTGLVNQGWKDSGDAIVNDDGSQAVPPIALCEVQGYVYRAWRDVAELLRDLGSDREAVELERRADELRERFDRSFWSDTLSCYVLARQAEGRPVEVVSSNAGQVLWTGIARPDRAARVAERMLAVDMFSGWGIRTLSAEARAYNPLSYHRGSIWPHDNGLILAGFRRYGHDRASLQVFDGLFAAASWFRNHRLPELFCGFPRTERENEPVPYPVACNPQAWAAGALPYALWSLLGIAADARGDRLYVCRPCLPDGVDELELRRLRAGRRAELDLRFWRGAGDTVEMEARVRGGPMEVIRDDKLAGPS